MTTEEPCVRCNAPIGSELSRAIRVCFVERGTSPATDREHWGPNREYIHLRCFPIPYGYKEDRSNL